jgi:hypothetical protein
MIIPDELRKIAMSLPEVEEGPPVPAARRILAFKVAGKSFLGLENGGLTMTLSLAEHDARAIEASNPNGHEEIWRHGKLLGLRLDLSKISSRELLSMVELSWRHSAPKRIAAQYGNRQAKQ